MCEVAQEAALRQSKTILVDGSLHDAKWYSGVFADIRRRFPQYRIGIFYVTADSKSINDRVHKRAAETRRTVPQGRINHTIEACPKSVAVLERFADLTVKMDNSRDAAGRDVDPTLLEINQRGTPIPAVATAIAAGDEAAAAGICRADLESKPEA